MTKLTIRTEVRLGNPPYYYTIIEGGASEVHSIAFDEAALSRNIASAEKIIEDYEHKQIMLDTMDGLDASQN